MHRRRRIRVGRRHHRERREQFGHGPAVVNDAKTHASPAGVLQQPVLRGGADQAVRHRVRVEQAVVSEAAILELAVNHFGVIRLVGLVGERPQSGAVLGAEQHHHVGGAGGDRPAELGYRMLRPLSPNGFQDRPTRCGPDSAGHRARIVGGVPQRSHPPAGDLELPDPDDRVDRFGHRTGYAGIGQGRPGGGSREIYRRHPAVGGIVDAFGELPNADQDRGARADHARHMLCRISRANAAVADGVLPTFTPAASRASFLAAAVPDDPDTMAPACPMVLPSGAVKPAT